MLPSTAEVIDNPIGTACGFALDIGKARFFFTPGVPRELKRMLEEQIIPRLLAKSGLQAAIFLKRFHSYGLGESHVDALLAGAEKVFKRGIVSRDLAEIYMGVGLPPAAASGELTPTIAEAVAEAARRDTGATHALAVLIDLDEGADRIEFGGTVCLAIATEGE